MSFYISSIIRKKNKKIKYLLNDKPAGYELFSVCNQLIHTQPVLFMKCNFF